MKNILNCFIVFILIAPLSMFAQNPFTFLGKPQIEVEKEIGKPTLLVKKEGSEATYLYRTATNGEYTIKYVSDTTRRFIYQPNATFTVADIPYTLKQAERQPLDNSTLLLCDEPKLQVYVKEGSVKKVVYLK